MHKTTEINTANRTL